jgi:hypothetical protein
MSKHAFSRNRRQTLARGVCGLGVAAGALAMPWGRRLAAQEAGQRVSEEEPLAQQLMYVHDAAKAPADIRAETEFCHNCNFFRAPSAEQMWAPCDIFGAREVAAEGWCNVWVARAE